MHGLRCGCSFCLGFTRYCKVSESHQVQLANRRTRRRDGAKQLQVLSCQFESCTGQVPDDYSPYLYTAFMDELMASDNAEAYYDLMAELGYHSDYTK